MRYNKENVLGKALLLCKTWQASLKKFMPLNSSYSISEPVSICLHLHQNFSFLDAKFYIFTVNKSQAGGSMYDSPGRKK